MCALRIACALPAKPFICPRRALAVGNFALLTASIGTIAPRAFIATAVAQTLPSHMYIHAQTKLGREARAERSATRHAEQKRARAPQQSRGFLDASCAPREPEARAVPHCAARAANENLSIVPFARIFRPRKLRLMDRRGSARACILCWHDIGYIYRLLRGWGYCRVSADV